MRQCPQRMDTAAQRGQSGLLGAGARHGQRTARNALHGLSQPQRALLRDEPPDKGDEPAARGHVQPPAPVNRVLCVGQPFQLGRVHGVGQSARCLDAERFQPAADIPGDTVEREPAAADAAAGRVLIRLAQRPGQPAVQHIAGGVVDDQRRDAAPLTLPRGPDALRVHPGLDDRKVDALCPEVVCIGKGL